MEITEVRAVIQKMIHHRVVHRAIIQMELEHGQEQVVHIVQAGMMQTETVVQQIHKQMHVVRHQEEQIVN